MSTAVCLALAAAGFAAAPKPNFSGRWRIDERQSSRGAPAELVQTVDVLRDQAANVAHVFPTSECAMRRIRLGLRELSVRLDPLLPILDSRLRVPRNSVLFLDDNAVNVEAAVGAGFVAQHVRGIDGARTALVAAGVLAV